MDEMYVWLSTKPVAKPSKQKRRLGVGSHEPQGMREQCCARASRARRAIEPQLPRASDQFAGHACSIGRGSSRELWCGPSSPNFFPSETPSTPLGRVATRHRPPRRPADIAGATTRPLATAWSPRLRQDAATAVPPWTPRRSTTPRRGNLGLRQRPSLPPGMPLPSKLRPDLPLALTGT